MLPPPPVLAVTPPGVVSAAAFRKAQLGMSLSAWRASAPHRAAATCTPSTVGVLACRVRDQPLGGTYRARELTHVFVGGRLSSIAFTSSIDAFAFTVAELRREYGDPAEIVRDRVRLASGVSRPRVRMIWRRAGSTIRLTDPIGRGGRLAVVIAADDLKPRAGQA